MSGITDVGANNAEEASSDNDGDYESDYERFDVTGLPFAKMHPTTAVRGEAVALRYFPDWQNDEPDRGYFGIVLDDPSVVTDDDDLAESVVVERDTDKQESGDDIKVVNLDDDATQMMPGDAGIDFDGNTFYGDAVDAVGDDRIVVKATGSSGRSIASTLDVKGKGGAHSIGAQDDEDVELHDGGFPEHSGHLVEYDPSDEDSERPRFARDSELRPDVEGREVIVMLQRLSEIDEDYDGDAYWATVFAETEDGDEADIEIDGTGFTSLEPTAEFEPSADLLRETGYIEFDGNRVDLDDLNEAREAEGFDPYEPGESGDETEVEAE